MSEVKKIRTVCIDTLTGIQNEEWMTNSKKPNHDTWMDYGKDIWKLISFLQDEGFEVIMILGEPGKILLSNFYNYLCKTKNKFYEEISNLLSLFLRNLDYKVYRNHFSN